MARHSGLIIMAVVALAASASAETLDDSKEEDTPVEVHGFVSQGFILSTGNNYLSKSKEGSFELTEVGINFTKSLTDRLRTGVQLFARDLGTTGNYSAKFDWFYLDYRFADWLGIRAGRTKLPFGLYNEINDIDSARVPILLPQSIYPVQNRDFLLALTGFELYGYLPLAAMGALDYRVYAGTIYIDIRNAPLATAVIQDLTVPYVVGGRLMWETPLDGLRIGGSVQSLRLDFHEGFTADARTALQGAGAIPATFDGSAGFKAPVLLWVGSLEYSANDLLLAAEYSRWKTNIDAEFPSLLPPKPKKTSERFYGMAAYRVTPWLSPSLYYSAMYPDVDVRKGRAAYMHDIAGTLRLDINAYWLFKLEGHFMRGAADLSPALNDNKTLREMTRDWWVFLAKTTVHF